jgi:cytidylate kinase
MIRTPGRLDRRRGRPHRGPSRQERESTIPDDSLARSIAIDGPTASGKSVVGRAVAEALKIGFFDTGLMYRACTLAVLRSDADPEDGTAVTALVKSLDLDMRWDEPTIPRIILEGVDVTAELRAPEIESAVSLVSRIPQVRDELVRRQRSIASREPVVMAGRDIGTRVLVEARTKIFLDASAETRARRRLGEELDSGRTTNFDQVLSATRRRDDLDNTGHRAIKREQAADDALVIDTDALGIDQVVERAIEHYRAANGRA